MTEVVLREACAVAGLDASGAELLRFGSNAVYRLAGAPVVVRIARDPESFDSLTRPVRVARWLEGEGFPAVRVVGGVEQPVLVDGRVVTYWANVQDTEEYADLGELADLLRGLHDLEPPADLELPHFDPRAKVHRGLQLLGANEARPFLEARAADLMHAYAQLNFTLPTGVIHGDANIGNALRDTSGRPLLIDLDAFSLAPREWDLILTALYYDRFGWHTRAEYETFARAYGFDILHWPGYQALADLRELMMVLWLGQQAATSNRSAAEFARRVDDIRTGRSRRGWQPF